MTIPKSLVGHPVIGSNVALASQGADGLPHAHACLTKLTYGRLRSQSHKPTKLAAIGINV